MNEHELQKLVERHQVALFGDENQKGIVDKIDEMYQTFSGTRFAGKLMMAIIITLGALALAFSQISGFFHDIFKKP